MSNPLGQIAEGVVEQGKSIASSTVSQAVSEPAKILEQILGGIPASSTPPSEAGSLAVEQGNPSASSGQAQPAPDSVLLQRKQQESQVTTAALYKLHQQRLQEEKQYYQEHKQEEIQQKQIEEHQEEEKQQIVQLKKEKADEAVWQQQIKAVQGSHEGQQGKM